MLCQKIKEPEIKAVQIHTNCAKKILNKNNKTLIASDLIKEISKCI
jgi:NAD(P)H-hydrate repair Nnr-like enzyme with NAD(P)H-hydrate dehydratase domain